MKKTNSCLVIGSKTNRLVEVDRARIIMDERDLQPILEEKAPELASETDGRIQTIHEFVDYHRDSADKNDDDYYNDLECGITTYKGTVLRETGKCLKKTILSLLKEKGSQVLYDETDGKAYILLFRDGNR